MAGHAILSPSSADRWMTCPASVPLSAGIPDSGSDAAREGTAAHYLAEQCLTLGKDAKEFARVTIWQVRQNGVEAIGMRMDAVPVGDDVEVLYARGVDDCMVEGVQLYLDYVRSIVAATGGELHVEVELPIDHLTGEEDATGTSDVVVLADKELIVVDLKYGHREVEAIGNRQMRFYGSGALRKFGLVEDFENVRVAIVQPNVSKQPSEWAFTVEELREFEDEVRKAASLVEAAKSVQLTGVIKNVTDYARPSEKACRYCRAKPCAALDRVVQEVTGITFDDLGDKLDKLNLISDWIKATEERAFNALKEGAEVKGAAGPYKLVQGRAGNRKWGDEAEVEAMMKAARLKNDEMYSYSVISPAVAEKVLAGKPKVWGKLQKCITQAEGKLSVAPATDKREAVTITPVAEQFDVLA